MAPLVLASAELFAVLAVGAGVLFYLGYWVRS